MLSGPVLTLPDVMQVWLRSQQSGKSMLNWLHAGAQAAILASRCMYARQAAASPPALTEAGVWVHGSQLLAAYLRLYLQGLLKVDGMARLGVRTLKGGLLGVDVSLNGSGPMTGIIDLVSGNLE
jgi:hypothetical protein